MFTEPAKTHAAHNLFWQQMTSHHSKCMEMDPDNAEPVRLNSPNAYDIIAPARGLSM